MTRKLSLDEMLELGKRVRKWKEREDDSGVDSFSGNYNEIVVETYIVGYGDDIDYGICVIDNIELGREHYAQKYRSGDARIKQFYERVYVTVHEKSKIASESKEQLLRRVRRMLKSK